MRDYSPAGFRGYLLNSQLGWSVEVECVRHDVCAYKGCSLSEFESVPVDEAKVKPVLGSLVTVTECEVEEEMCALSHLF